PSPPCSPPSFGWHRLPAGVFTRTGWDPVPPRNLVSRLPRESRRSPARSAFYENSVPVCGILPLVYLPESLIEHDAHRCRQVEAANLAGGHGNAENAAGTLGPHARR